MYNQSFDISVSYNCIRTWLFSCFFIIQNCTGHSTLFQFTLLVIYIFKNMRNFTEVWMQKVRWKNHVFNQWWNKNLMNPSISRLQCHFKETVYFLPFSPQECQVLNWSTSEGWKACCPYSHPVVLSWRPLDWESSTFTTISLLHELRKKCMLMNF